MGKSKNITIKGNKKQKILLGIQVFIIAFMLIFAVIGKHFLKIDDSIISNVMFGCIILVVVILNIISFSNKEDNKKEE